MSHTPPGWYPDPELAGAIRWWDGTGWTHQRAMSVQSAVREPLPSLPLAVAIGALVTLAVPLVASRPLLSVIVTWHLPIAVNVLISGVLAYGPSLWWWRWSSRRYATGHPAEDVGLQFRVADTGWGPLTWLACIVAQAVVVSVLLAADVPFTSNTADIREGRHVLGFVVPIVVLAVVIAPVVEEIVFRGLVLRGFVGRMPVAVAVGVQAVLFGAAHFDPDRGMGNIGLLLALSALGGVLGTAAWMARRLGPVVIAHAVLNGVAMAVALSGWKPK